ncbi:MAG: acyl-CoA dehydrogenase family protein [Acidimicrobiia bacterium]
MSDDLLASTLDHLFGDRCSNQVRRAAARGVWSQELWTSLEAAGMTRIGVAEEYGGAGGTFRDVVTLVRIAGFHAAPLPLLEQALAGWLLASSGAQIPDGPLGLGHEVNGRRVVAWGRNTAHVVTIEEDGTISLLPSSSVTFEQGTNLAGEPRDIANPDVVRASQRLLTSMALAGEFRLREAIGRAAMLAGACARVVELSIDYARQREQFGRPIARFQAVGQQLAVMAAESAAASVLIIPAIDAVVDDPHGGRAELLAISARVRASRAATTVARIGHQIHGAMGVTAEHELHHYTLRLLSWRDEGGTEREWMASLGACVDSMGEAALWAATS